MIVCLLEGLYLDANLTPAYPANRLDTRLLLNISLLILLLRLYYMRGGNWCYLDYGESVACVTWVCVG